MMSEAIFLGALGSLFAGLMTTVGACPVLVGRRPSVEMNNALLAFAAGVMLAASFFSLLVPAIDASTRLYGSEIVSAAIAVGGTSLGIASIALLNRYLPHEHFFQGREGPESIYLKRIWLFVIAITLHNAPEGMAVGVAFVGGDISNGLPLTIGIGLQNIPEGLAVAVALVSVGYSRFFAFFTATLTGLIEPVAGVLGAAVVDISTAALPWGLSFAAGAMIYVISHEIIPETHRQGSQHLATIGLTIGLCLMMFLDVAMG